MLDKLHKESFAGAINTDFQANLEGPAVLVLKLTEVIERVHTSRQEAFSLIFHGPADPFLPQGMVKLVHEKMGEFEIFLVPIGRDKDGFQYEAVFNHLIPPAHAN